MRNPAELLGDMCDAIEGILRHAKDRREFETDEVLQGFVVYQLMIVGEAAYRMPDDYRKDHPEIPWRGMAGMRHILVHGYFVVDLDIVWGVVEQDLPGLIDILRGLA